MLLNDQVARRLDEVASLLNEQGAHLYRAQAYRRAATTVRRLHVPVWELFKRDGLKKLPGVGERLAMAIRNLIVTGKLPILDRLRGEADPHRAAYVCCWNRPGASRAAASRVGHRQPGRT